MPTHLIDIPIRDRSQIGAARRHAERIAADSGLSADAASRITLITVEAATNILRHGGPGSILLNPAPDGAPPAVMMVAQDSGPGIPDLDEAMRDGHSSVGGMGGGLGAIRRLSDWADIFTQPGKGTVLAAVVGDEGAGLLPRACGLLAPMPGQTACGDGWAVREHGGETWAMLCDGLGHGEKAARAAEAASRAFNDADMHSLPDLMTAIDKALAGERGAAVLLVRIQPDEGRAEAIGVGNISGAIVSASGEVQRLMSHGGVVGAEMRSSAPIAYRWDDRSTLILATDGLRTIHDFTAWAGLLRRGPLTIAGVIHRDMARGSDDTGLLAVKGRAA